MSETEKEQHWRTTANRVACLDTKLKAERPLKERGAARDWERAALRGFS